MDGYIVEVDGVPFFLLIRADGYYVGAVGQRVDVNGSPVIVSFDPPIAPTVDLGEIYRRLSAML